MIVLLFIAALAVLILSHELGHFIVAKISGAKVEEFGLGFPPRLFGFKKGETVYSINWIPFGGFVKIFGEDSNDKKARSFSSQPAYGRAAVLFAGVFFNIILAWILLGTVNFIGAPASVAPADGPGQITILEVQKDTPAETAGLLAGDKILQLSSGGDVLEADTVLGAQSFISRHGGHEIELQFLRGQEKISVKAVPDLNPREGKGALGIAMDRIGTVSLPLHKAFWQGTKDTIFLTSAIAKAFISLLADIFKGGNMALQVRGPVGIVGMVGTAFEFGFVYVLQFVALFSINLAILNLIPFPALDGGRLLFLAIETVKRSPINQKFVSIANTAGFVVLILLMLLVTYKDILRLF